MWVLQFIRASAAKPNTGWSYRECCLISSGKIWEQLLAGGKCSVNGSCSLFSHRQALLRSGAPRQLVIQREESPFFPRMHTADLLAAPRTLPGCGPTLGWTELPGCSHGPPLWWGCCLVDLPGGMGSDLRKGDGSGCWGVRDTCIVLHTPGHTHKAQ